MRTMKKKRRTFCQTCTEGECGAEQRGQAVQGRKQASSGGAHRRQPSAAQVAPQAPRGRGSCGGAAAQRGLTFRGETGTRARCSCSRLPQTPRRTLSSRAPTPARGTLCSAPCSCNSSTPTLFRRWVLVLAWQPPSERHVRAGVGLTCKHC